MTRKICSTLARTEPCFRFRFFCEADKTRPGLRLSFTAQRTPSAREARLRRLSGSERLTGALLDRLTHHVNILEMNGDSYRLAQSRGRKGIAINQGQDRLALAGQSAQAPASYIESAGTWAPSAFLVPDSGTLKWPTFAPPHGRFLLRR